MAKVSLIPLLIATACGMVVCSAGARRTGGVQEHPVILLERAALDRWGRGDPSGFLETYGPEITYFDVATERRIDGHAAMTDYYRPIVGQIKVARYEMIGAKVQRHGNVVVLTYNLRSEGVRPDGKEVTVRWNSTSVYALMGDTWKTIHSHWSLTALPCAKGTM